jgi:hypothetical protein
MEKKQREFQAHAAWIEWSVTRKRRHHDLEDPHIDPVVQDHMTVSEASLFAAQLQRQQDLQLQRRLQRMLVIQQEQQEKQQQQQFPNDFSCSRIGSHTPQGYTHNNVEASTQAPMKKDHHREAKMRRLDGIVWGALHVLTNLHHSSKYAH